MIARAECMSSAIIVALCAVRNRATVRSSDDHSLSHQFICQSLRRLAQRDGHWAILLSRSAASCPSCPGAVPLLWPCSGPSRAIPRASESLATRKPRKPHSMMRISLKSDGHYRL
eukprot:COSAG06_NODE_631_length_13616_cov_6.997411_7_plen_115_part_00